MAALERPETVDLAPRSWLVGVIYLLVLVAPLAAWRTVAWSQTQAYERLSAQGADRLTLYGVTLRSEIEKYSNVPLVLSSDPEVRELLLAPQPAAALVLSQRLDKLDATLGASAIYVLDRAGMTLSASNYQDGPGSFVGQRFDYRPYFTAAMEGHPGRYFALGSTSNQPGYYFAMPVLAAGQTIGAVVVKMSMDLLERGWSGGGERVFVTDRHGIVFITNTPHWRFRSLSPLDAEESRIVMATRQYGDQPLRPLGLVTGETLVSVDGSGYVMASAPLEDGEGWRLHVLLDVRDAQDRARDLGLLAVAGLVLAVLVLYFIVHRSRLLLSHNRDLERRVDERTAALVDSNQRLQEEILERRRTEDELKSKQEELVQAAKLAALGQMSAGMAHEINQPLAAIRSYADNAVTFLDLERLDMARDNLGEIADLTERMARITGQLKQFARKSSGRAEPVAVTRMVEGALALLAGRLRAEDVELLWDPPAESLRVWGDEVRLQQVLINLFRNGLDAMTGCAERRLGIEVQATAETVTIAVRDSGGGIAAESMTQLFDPFFTTKPAGEGLGLGLSISEGIVGELGGHLSAANHPDGGAVFTIALRRAEPLT